MFVFRNLPVLLHPRTLFALFLLLVTTVSYAKGPEAPLRIPLSTLGFQPPSAWVLAAGGAISTVQFVDEQHLLVAFPVHRLMKRLSDCPPDDQDRMIEAVVVHLPSGKVIARTQWRVHDIGQYLWNLGDGRFLLRVRSKLTTFVPLANLANEDPFVEQPLLMSKRQIVAVLLSPDRDLLTVETVERPPTVTEGSHSLSTLGRTQINFYRLVQPVRPMDQVILQSAGVAGSNGPGNISLISAGHIEVLQESHDRWLFDFDPYEGKYVELSPFDTSCRPQSFFVSSSEFVAFGCRGSEDRQTMGGFNLAGEQMWQQEFTEPHALSNFAMAPAAGRFVLSRNIVHSGSGMTANFAPPSVTTQEIRVYQTYTGKQLLQIEASPVQRFGENYDLSLDGLRFAVIRGDAVEVHTLPRLTAADETAVHHAKTLQPQDAKVFVNLALRGGAESADKAQVSVVQVVAPASGAALQTQAADPLASSEESPDKTPRKPPTLYTLPTDRPEEKPQ